jgi:hypothetical protein
MPQSICTETGTDSDSVADFAAHPMSDSAETSCGVERASLIAEMHRQMQSAFIRWHVTGCFMAAAEYQQTRTAWELALMGEGCAE